VLTSKKWSKREQKNYVATLTKVWRKSLTYFEILEDYLHFLALSDITMTGGKW